MEDDSWSAECNVHVWRESTLDMYRTESDVVAIYLSLCLALLGGDTTVIGSAQWDKQISILYLKGKLQCVDKKSDKYTLHARVDLLLDMTMLSAHCSQCVEQWISCTVTVLCTLKRK